MTIQTIGNDKLNQLRHARFFKDVDGLKTHMKLHAQKLRPRFELIINAFESELAGKGIASWTNPNGGYFISLDVLDGCAKKVVKMCKDAGLVLTGAGATFPYGNDENDRNIRIAPSYPSIDELKQAVEGLCICVQLVCVEKLLEK